MSSTTDDLMEGMSKEQLKAEILRMMAENVEAKSLLVEVTAASDQNRKDMLNVVTRVLIMIEDVSASNELVRAMMQVHAETLRNLKIRLL